MIVCLVSTGNPWLPVQQLHGKFFFFVNLCSVCIHTVMLDERY